MIQKPTQKGLSLLVLVICLCFGQAAVSAEPTTQSFIPSNSAAEHGLNGLLELDFRGASIEVINRAPFLPAMPSSLPVFKVNLISLGRDVVPVERGLNVTDNRDWDYILGPGRSWQEGDKSIAVLPLTLVTRSVGCTHNGLIRLEYNRDRITRTNILVGQETCHFLRVNITGDGIAHFTRLQHESRTQLEARWKLEQANRIPTFSLSSLEDEYPLFDLALFKTGLPDNDDLSKFGFYYKGKHYASGCNSRFSPYPLCDQMLMTSFSTAKTAFAGLALIAMAEEFGPEVYTTKISSLLPEASSAKGNWDEVTLDHLNDMTSGNYSIDTPMADPEPGSFYFDLDRDGKLQAAFSWPNSLPPGEKFVYQTADTFIQIAALDAYLNQQEADVTDTFDYLVSRVYKPLHLQPEVLATRRTRDKGVNNSGTAFGGMGMWWSSDAVVKIARLMLLEGGKIDKRQVLNPEALAATMQKNLKDTGIETGFYGFRYNNNTWALPTDALGAQFSCDAYVPVMSGLSGVRVFMMPNGLIFYYFNDGQKFPAKEAIIGADKLSPFC
jgi:hypothetical protein